QPARERDAGDRRPADRGVVELDRSGSGSRIAADPRQALPVARLPGPQDRPGRLHHASLRRYRHRRPARGVRAQHATVRADTRAAAHGRLTAEDAMLTLIVETDGASPKALKLTRFPSRIGRQADSAVRLAGWRVARTHAEIHRIDTGFKLVARGSLGGTWVNGERIVEYAPLGDDDEISIAGYRLRVHPAADPFAGALAGAPAGVARASRRSEEHTSELQ